MLDKSIEHGKEHRKPYQKSKRFDRSCRNNGSCPHCESDRTARESAKKQASGEALREYRTK